MKGQDSEDVQRTQACCEREGSNSVPGNGDILAGLAQHPLEQAPNGLFIIDNEHARRTGVCVVLMGSPRPDSSLCGVGGALGVADPELGHEMPMARIKAETAGRWKFRDRRCSWGSEHTHTHIHTHTHTHTHT